MRKGIVVDGDLLSSGGTVSSSKGYLINGLKVVLEGDPCNCPIHGPGLVKKGSGFKLNGIPMALEGDSVSCGCQIGAKLVGTQAFAQESNSNSCDVAEKDPLSQIMEKILDVFNDSVSKDTKESICAVNKVLNETQNELPISGKINLRNLKKNNAGSEFAKSMLNSWCNHSGSKQKCTLEKTSNNNLTKIEYVPPEGAPKDLKCDTNPLKGGAHKKTRLPIGDKLDSHHMPAKSAYKGSKMNPDGKANNGPAIKMYPEDHKKTGSHVSKGMEAKIYIEKQRKLIQEGKYFEALNNEVSDVRKVAVDADDPYRYECAIKEMLEYANTLNPSDFIVR